MSLGSRVAWNKTLLKASFMNRFRAGELMTQFEEASGERVDRYFRSWRGEEYVLLKKRVPVAWKKSKGEKLWFMSDGSWNPHFDTNSDFYPQIKGFTQNWSFADRKKFAELFEKTDWKNFKGESIQNIEVLRNRDGYKLDYKTNLIYMGVEDPYKNLKRVDSVLGYLESQKLIGRVIDSRLNKKVLVRLKPSS